MKYSTVIWDLDGTLLDTLQDLADAVNHALQSCGMPCRTLEEIRQFVGNGVRKLMIRAVPEGEANPLFDHAFDVFQKYYLAHCQDNTRPYDGIITALQQLKEHGVRMAIVSNKLQEGVTELHEKWFAKYIDVAVGERAGLQRKPASDMVYFAMKQLGADTEKTIYIGDSDVDILTAQNTGIPCISVSWGFRDREFLLAHGAENIAASPEDVAEMITKK